MSRRGAWTWLQFHNEPWEGDSSPFHGATLAAIAIHSAPGGYAALPENHDRVKALDEYLQKGNEKQALLSRAMLLWASTLSSAMLTARAAAGIVESLLGAQQEDGGWSTASLGTWKRADGTPLDTRSDGYATGLVTFALESLGDARAQAQVRRGLTWLVTHQDPATGAWFAASLNKKRDPGVGCRQVHERRGHRLRCARTDEGTVILVVVALGTRAVRVGNERQTVGTGTAVPLDLAGQQRAVTYPDRVTP